MNILLIAGGWSTERDVSLNGAKNIAEALTSLGHEYTLFDPLESFNDFVPQALKHDFAFIALHGAPGEDGLFQAMLEQIHVPYQGSGPAASFLALNKAAAKQVFRNAGLKTADWHFLPAMPEGDWRPNLDWPLFVKSNTGGSSLHLYRVENEDELNAMLNKIFAANEEALIEPQLRGQEITCGVLGDEALPPILIEPLAGAFFDYTSKYVPGAAREICPAPITAAQTAQAQKLALAAHRALGCHGYSRSDFILDENGEFTILEVNTLPGMTSNSLVPKEAAQIGISFNELIGKLIELGMKRNS